MHVLITGASSGIGEALARRFAAEPDTRVTLVARRGARLAALAAELPDADWIASDLTAPGAVASCLSAATARGPVDVLVNNAGTQVVSPTATTDLQAAERSLTLDLVIPLRFTHALLPGWLDRGEGGVIDIASMAALAPTPGMTWYNAAKGGLAAASEALRGELAGSGVHAMTVYPGIIQTEMATQALAKYHSSFALSLQPTATPEQLADVVVAAWTRRSSRVIYPRMNALARHFPGATRWVMDRLAPPLVTPCPA